MTGSCEGNGYTAFEIMRRAPERVTRLALASTTTRADTPERLDGWKAQGEMDRAARFDEAIEPFLTMIENTDTPLDSAVRETVRAMCQEGEGPHQPADDDDEPLVTCGSPCPSATATITTGPNGLGPHTPFSGKEAMSAQASAQTRSSPPATPTPPRHSFHSPHHSDVITAQTVLRRPRQQIDQHKWTFPDSIQPRKITAYHDVSAGWKNQYWR